MCVCVCVCVCVNMMHQSCLSTTTKIEFFHYMAEVQSLHVGTSTSEVANWSP